MNNNTKICKLYKVFRSISPYELTPDQMERYIRNNWSDVQKALFKRGKIFNSPDDLFSWVEEI